jgi:hypothetical protein
MGDQIAHFVGCHNIPIQTIGSPDFRDPIEFAFREGHRHGSRNRGQDVDAAFRAFCPVQKCTAIRKRIATLASADRAVHERLISKTPYPGVTMDSGQIGRLKMLVINLVASDIPLCFTEDAFKVGKQNTDIARDFVTITVTFLAARKI